MTQIRTTIHANNPALGHSNIQISPDILVAGCHPVTGCGQAGITIKASVSSFSGSWFQISIFHHQASAKSSADNPNTHCLMLNIQNIQNISDLWLTGGHMMEEPDGEGENICLPVCVYSWSGDDREVWHSTEQPSPSRQVTAVYEGSLRGGAHSNNYIINFPDWI